jgi:hypothetical protein
VRPGRRAACDESHNQKRLLLPHDTPKLAIYAIQRGAAGVGQKHNLPINIDQRRLHHC